MHSMLHGTHAPASEAKSGNKANARPQDTWARYRLVEDIGNTPDLEAKLAQVRERAPCRL